MLKRYEDLKREENMEREPLSLLPVTYYYKIISTFKFPQVISLINYVNSIKAYITKFNK